MIFWNGFPVLPESKSRLCFSTPKPAFFNQRSMRILFDQGTPAPLRRHLHPDTVDTTGELGWSTVSNGDLLKLAEDNGYEVFVTTDQNLRYQQNLTGRRMGIVVLLTTSWPRIQKRIPAVLAAISVAHGGGYEEVII